MVTLGGSMVGVAGIALLRGGGGGGRKWLSLDDAGL